MTNKLRYLPRPFDKCTLAEKLEVAAANVERAREIGIAEHLAGWEHLVIREALATFSTPTEDARERVKVLEEALERIANSERAAGIYDTLGNSHIARTALGNKETDRG